MDTALGGDLLSAVKTPALVVVVVGQVLGNQLQAVIASGHGPLARRRSRQGIRVLSGEHLQQVVISPSCLQPFALDAHFQTGSRFNWLWDICLSVAMFWGLWSLRTRLWSSLNVTVQAPVQRILYAPVGPYRVEQPLR